MKKVRLLIVAVLLLALAAAWYTFFRNDAPHESNITLESIPAFSGSAYIVLDENKPDFAEDELVTESYEFYSQLDALGRCGYAMACIGIDIMPTEERGSIGQVKPSGWQTVKYDFVDGKYLYNRCHLIGFQLAGENANVKNLITGTRYLNVEGMLPFENMVADYVKETEHHVIYRVTPIYDGNNLVASGVQMEAFSVEDNGDGICFNVYAYNNQPGVIIDYATGASRAATENAEPQQGYILNTNTKKIHTPDCALAEDINENNKKTSSDTRENLITQGYSPCKTCNP